MQKKYVKSILILAGVAGTVIVATLLVFPQFWSAHSCKPPCSSVESDTEAIAAMIADYFSVPDRRFVKPEDLSGWFQTENPWTINQCGDVFYIYVYDLKQDCPKEYQNNNPGWNSSIYTKILE